MHSIIEMAPDSDDAIGDEIEALPAFPHDDDFDAGFERAIEDEDVLMLFEEGDIGRDSDSDSDGPVNVDNPVLGPGSTAAIMLQQGDK